MSPPCRVLSAFLWAWWIVLFQKPAFLTLIIPLLILSPVTFSVLFSRLFQLNIFLIPLMLWFVLTNNPQWQIFWQANTVLMGVTLLLGKLDIFQLAGALQYLKFPIKLVYLLFFTVRYLEVLKEMFQKIQRAMQIRGFKLQTNLHTYRSIGNALGMLLIKSLSKAQRIEQAMRCRGFQGQFYSFNKKGFNTNDYLFLSAFLILLIILNFL
ncbi:MAG: cobalt transporter component CbiQ [Pseudomonadota bacterium]